MKRKLVMVFLALGIVSGYGSAIAHAVHHHHSACAGWQHPPGQG